MEWNGSGDSIGFWTIKGDAPILSHGLNSVQGLLNLFISVGRVCPCNSSPGSEKGIYSNSRSHNSPIWGRGEIRKLATVVLPCVFWPQISVRFPAHTCHAWAFYYSIIVFIFILAPHLFIILSPCSSLHCVSKSCTQENKSCFPYKKCTFASGKYLALYFSMESS